ncbi:hypothetical protein C900_00382 [Fulvivirga imtechensis AK7]|uniref:Uncharacterized protein n=1 Tax=Fulvivirga imtechensis AK7 TaxID=1237149 RepID=L8JLM5_9BACT|nr:hypothetical protein [Fulvivirga imtechensis]ELR68414.1 hypothetical protein C900_00382 [Fulvivirga imtechensis AK7]
MSDRELDHLFKSKLDELEKRPSARAWDEIQSNITTKNKRSTWFYSGIAAAIVVLAAVGSVLWVNRGTEQPVVTIAEKSEVGSRKAEDRSEKAEVRSPKSEVGSTKSEVEGNSSMVTKEPLLALNNTSSNRTDTNTKQQTANRELSSENKEPQTGNSKLETENSELLTVNSDLRTENSELKTQNGELRTENSELKTSTDQKQEPNGQTLIFNIEDFDSRKALTTNNNESEQGKDKRSSTLRKVLDFAKNVKEGDAGLGELREAKNELFALNFKKDDDSK